MWQPEPGWHPLPGGTGPSTLGVWRTVVSGRPMAVKRLVRPGAGDPDELCDHEHPHYWRREALVAGCGLVESTPGLRASPLTSVEEDDEGLTITSEWHDDAASSGLFAAGALGRFAGADLTRPDGGRPEWLARDLLRHRVRRVERRGGWRVLARTTVADVAAHLWQRRGSLLASLDDLPQVPAHGDPARANLPGRVHDDVVAIDWGSLGTAPVGLDLGLLALGAREAFEPLLDAYLLGLPEGVAEREQVAHGARVTAVLTALSRAEWALSRVAGGEGALAGKYRHPAVAPHLRVLQRQFPLVEQLLERA